MHRRVYFRWQSCIVHPLAFRVRQGIHLDPLLYPLASNNIEVSTGRGASRPSAGVQAAGQQAPRSHDPDLSEGEEVCVCILHTHEGYPASAPDTQQFIYVNLCMRTYVCDSWLVECIHKPYTYYFSTLSWI